MADLPFTAKTDFRHHKTNYEQGEEYTEPEGMVVYFVLSGWAESAHVNAGGQIVVPDEVDLEVQDVTSDQTPGEAK